MRRVKHDYDMGHHAPWCAACGAEDDAESDARYEFEAEKATALLDMVKDGHKLLDALSAAAQSETFTTAYDRADELIALATDLAEKAQEPFVWSPPGADYDGPDTIEERDA